MNTKFFSRIVSGIPAAIVVGCFLFFGSWNYSEKVEDYSPPKNCCTGYRIAMNDLQQFMIDSLSSSAFEGGIFAKKDLQKAINSVNGDSVYLMNAVLNCEAGQGNGLILTSPNSGQVSIVSRNPYCSPCPGFPCCPPNVCATRIKRNCVNYKPYASANNGSTTTNLDIDSP